ncbi:MAG TPA: UPF0182 family protein, partial [Anaerolineae bacterium]
TLLNQRGSSIVFGNLLVIPIDKSMIYVQSLYLLAQSSQIPQLKYVIVATGTSLSMQPTLAGALAQVFSGLGTPIAGPTAPTTTPPTSTSPGGPTTTLPPDIAALAKEANDHYAKAQDALKIADWTTYGAEMTLLQQALTKLVQATGQK